MNEVQHKPPYVTNVTLEELIAQPLTAQALDAYRARCRQLDHAIARFVGWWTVAVLVWISVSIVLFLEVGGRNLVWLALYCAICFLSVTGGKVATAGSYALSKFPMELRVDGKDWLQGTLAKPFEPVAVSRDNLAGSVPALALHTAILNQGRQPVFFEKQLLQSLCNHKTAEL